MTERPPWSWSSGRPVSKDWLVAPDPGPEAGEPVGPGLAQGAGQGDPGSPRARHLVAARIVEQVALGLASFVLAGVLGPADFAPIALLALINSFAVVASDFGLGLTIMRHAPGRPIATRDLRLLRFVNLGIAVVVVSIGASIDGETGWIVALTGLLWATSAEAFVRKSAAMRLREEVGVARSEILGAVVLLVVAMLAVPLPDWALQLMGAAFVAKHLVEAVAVRRWAAEFAPDGDRVDPLAIWGGQVLSFGTNNVDYVVVSIFFSPAAFAVYSLGWRVANLAPSQLARVVNRVSLVGFAADAGRRAGLYYRYMRSMFQVGVAATVLTVIGAFLLPLVLTEWGSATMVIVVLAVAVPFRLVLGVVISLAMGSVDRRLFGWEAVRLVAFAIVLTGLAQVGFAAVIAGITVLHVATTVVYDHDLGAAAGLRRVTYLLPAAIAATVLAVALAPLVSTP